MLVHMDMLGEVLNETNSMKANPDWSMQQTAHWVSEHQRIVKEVLRQMAEEHGLMMKALSAR